MPGQRLYPEGFGAASDDGTEMIVSGVRRKW
jgi:hypothetical protein